jgi:hypothetical protein
VLKAVGLHQHRVTPGLPPERVSLKHDPPPHRQNSRGGVEQERGDLSTEGTALHEHLVLDGGPPVGGAELNSLLRGFDETFVDHPRGDIRLAYEVIRTARVDQPLARAEPSGGRGWDAGRAALQAKFTAKGAGLL